VEPQLRFRRTLEENGKGTTQLGRHEEENGKGMTSVVPSRAKNEAASAAEGNTLFLKESIMPKELTWNDPDDIGILLSETHPELDPLAVRFTDLHKYVTALPDFKDDPAKSNEAKLEAIQMAWHAEVLDRTQG
jgi:FeS assembly protein IscX